MATTQPEPGFHVIAEGEVDSRRRLSLGRVGKREHTRYEIRENEFGEILLLPIVSIPAREELVWRNPELRASLERGMEQASAGKIQSLGDFSQYLDTDDNDSLLANRPQRRP